MEVIPPRPIWCTRPRVFTSTPSIHSRPSTSARRPLSISGIEQELEITVSTIIESEDSDVLGSDDAGDRGTSTTTATTDDEVLSPPKPEQPAQQSAQPEPVAGPSTPGPREGDNGVVGECDAPEVRDGGVIGVTLPRLDKHAAILRLSTALMTHHPHHLHHNNINHNREETGTCGTVRKFRKHWPAFPDTQERGTVKKKECGPMLALQWVDKRPVNILTTVHTGDLQDSGKVDHHTQEPVKKPDAVIDYNINMRLVDKSDMMQLTQNTSLSLRLLERQIISQLFEKFGTILPRIGAVRDVNDRMAAAEYMAAHKLVLNPLRPSGRAGFNKCQVCMYTSRRDKKRTETKYRCAACNVALCPVNCFAEFHSLENY
ncbi:hypothetical protein O3P69_016192 [Scylla paramamosain]|uniref:PiggyBac transposable element-derived protein domain-containing protein n=1 Tax=Scylla paramamosain TaxID=85552 RepID=A0AAW0SB31_SCYPA